MFRQFVTPNQYTLNPASKDIKNNINSLFTYHPLQLSAIIETVWLNRYNATPTPISSPFVPWPLEITYPILNAPFIPGYNWPTPITGLPNTSTVSPLQGSAFVPPFQQPGLGWAGTPPTVFSPPTPPTHPTNWDHLIYAYVIENTRIYEIFSKLLNKYIHGGELETPTPASQLFWRNLEFLIYGDAAPSMVWTTSGRLRRDEQACRCSTYYWMFGIDLSHAPQIAGEHPYEKPADSNRDFIPTFEAFGREVWRGIVNARNISGANDTDPRVIANLSERIYDMMQTQRQSGNQSREEFRAVAIMSYLHLAVLYDSPAVQDLRAEASSPELRLQKMAERVGMSAHPKSKALFDLAGPFSKLMQALETGKYNTAANTPLLYQELPSPTPLSRNAEDVIDQYTLATGRDLKSLPVSVVQRATTASLPAPKRQAPPQLPAPRVNGRAHHGQ
jgi:hypothetical protein